MSHQLETPLAESLEWRPLRRTELKELSGLLTAIETVDEPTERHTLADLVTAFEAPGAEPEADTRVGWAGDTPVGFGWNSPFDVGATADGGDVGGADGDGADGGGAGNGGEPRRVWLRGGVHPGWRRRGIGGSLVGWQLARARRWYADRAGSGPLWLLAYVDARRPDQAALLTANGFTPERWYLDMTRAVRPLPRLALPEGMRLHRYEDRWREPVRLAHNAAFADHWGARPIDAEQWLRAGQRPSFRRDWSWVATLDGPGADGGEETVVGYAINSAPDWDSGSPREGWTDRLGVPPSWRGRGIAQALLTRSLHSFADAGLDTAGLGVDTDTPERSGGLYRRLGYRVSETVVLYLRTEEPTARAD